VFEPHLKGYVELEEKQLTESVEALLAAETWSGDESTMSAPGAPKVLGSASQVFLNIKKVLKRCSALTRGATLFALSQARRVSSRAAVVCIHARRCVLLLPAARSHTPTRCCCCVTAAAARPGW
jgi:hypothetical protein